MEEDKVLVERVFEEIKKAVVGKDKVIQKVVMAILARGHVLIEDIPGVGKTTLALAISKAMELTYHRMQFTPDVLPPDVVGYNYIQTNTGETVFREGSIFCNLFLADEINRTSSKTQSALLEVMEEGKVTVDAVTHLIAKPFHVIATQNPIGSIGTQLLPESQVDRFMIRISMGYPDISSEIAILKGHSMSEPLKLIRPVLTAQQLLQLQANVDKVFVHDAVYDYIARLAKRTREHELIALGMSPRGTLALVCMAKAFALTAGRRYVIPEDVKEVFLDVAGHRLILSSKARIRQSSLENIVSQILEAVVPPRLISKNQV